jgi:hypothetical protein
MSSTNWTVFSVLIILFALTLATLLYVRYRAEGKASLAFTDVLVALVPLVVWVFLGGSVSELALGPEGLTVKKVVNALRASVDLPITGNVEYSMDVVAFSAIDDYLPLVDLQDDDQPTGDANATGSEDTSANKESSEPDSRGDDTDKSPTELMNERLKDIVVIEFTLGSDKITVEQARNLFEQADWVGVGEDGYAENAGRILFVDGTGKFVALCDGARFASYSSVDLSNVSEQKYDEELKKQTRAHFEAVVKAFSSTDDLAYFLPRQSDQPDCLTPETAVAEKDTLSQALEKVTGATDTLAVVDDRGDFVGELDPTDVVNRLVVEIVKSTKQDASGG